MPEDVEKTLKQLGDLSMVAQRATATFKDATLTLDVLGQTMAKMLKSTGLSTADVVEQTSAGMTTAGEDIETLATRLTGLTTQARLEEMERNRILLDAAAVRENLNKRDAEIFKKAAETQSAAIEKVQSLQTAASAMAQARTEAEHEKIIRSMAGMGEVGKVIGAVTAVGEALARLNPLTFVILELIRLLNAGIEVERGRLGIQTSLTSAGGALNMGMFGLTGVMTTAALKATELQLNLSDITSAVAKLERSSFLATTEIANAAGTSNTASSSFRNMRESMLVDLTRTAANVISMAPIFGKTTDGMVDMMIKLRSSLNVPLNQMEASFSKVATISQETGISTDVLFGNMTRLGETLKFAGVGIDQIGANFSVLYKEITKLDGSLAFIGQNTQLATQFMTSLANTMMQIPVEQMTGMIMAMRPEVSPLAAMREAVGMDPLQKLATQSNFFISSLQGTTEDIAGALFAGLPELKKQGAEGLKMADFMVRLGPQLSVLANLNSEEQKDYLGRIDTRLASDLAKLGADLRAAELGPLGQILQSIKNIEAVVANPIFSSISRLWTGTQRGMVGGLASTVRPGSEMETVPTFRR